MNHVVEVLNRLRAGQSVREVSRDLALARNTVRRYERAARRLGVFELPELPAAESLEPLFAECRSHGRPRQASSLEPFEEVIGEYLRQGLTSLAVWQRLTGEHSYAGSYSSVLRMVRRLRPKRPGAVCRVESAPGQEAQVDFGYAGLRFDEQMGTERRCWVFVMTLSYSRHQYVEFVFDQRSETWLGCHMRAFEFFGGVPARVVLDNLKAGVRKALAFEPVLAEPYRRLARHYGFQISPNRKATPEHKGKVESGVGYVKRSFCAGREFADVKSMNEAVREWVMHTAGTRDHGTTHEAPLKRFREHERQALSALPAQAFQLVAAYQCKVARDCHVVVEKSYYSVPFTLIGQKVDVYVSHAVVEVFNGCQLVTTHARATKAGGRRTRMEHYPEHKRESLELGPSECRERAGRIGPGCARLVEELLSDRVQDFLPSARRLVQNAGKYGRQAVEAACQRAIAYADPTYLRVKQILRAGLQDEPIETRAASDAASRKDYCFARTAGEFFQEAAP